jgi:hypothetical protein
MQNYLQFWNLRIGFIGRNLTLPNITLIIDDFNLRITGWGHFSALPHIISISGDFKLENIIYMILTSPWGSRMIVLQEERFGGDIVGKRLGQR